MNLDKSCLYYHAPPEDLMVAPPVPIISNNDKEPPVEVKENFAPLKFLYEFLMHSLSS